MSVDKQGKNSVNTSNGRPSENKQSSGGAGGSSAVTNVRDDTATKVGNILDKK